MFSLGLQQLPYGNYRTILTFYVFLYLSFLAIISLMKSAHAKSFPTQSPVTASFSLVGIVISLLTVYEEGVNSANMNIFFFFLFFSIIWNNMPVLCDKVSKSLFCAFSFVLYPSIPYHWLMNLIDFCLWLLFWPFFIFYESMQMCVIKTYQCQPPSTSAALKKKSLYLAGSLLTLFRERVFRPSLTDDLLYISCN